MKIKILRVIGLFAYLLTGCQSEQQPVNTFCNPVDLSYRFSLNKPSSREAADPTLVWFRDRYYLFASKSGGYFYSKNLINWTLVETKDLPTENYAPTAVAIEDTLYFMTAPTNGENPIYKTTNPLSGKWSVAVEKLDIPVWDPALFLDDNKHLYLYWGCSDKTPLYGVELDYNNHFSFIGKPASLKYASTEQLGWEVRGDHNTMINEKPWIEGAWMNKHNGKYYFQYAAPGAQYRSYCDGVCVSDNPLGPFILQKHNPFAYRPEGFVTGAGHGSTFTDRYGNFWHIGSVIISQKQTFERRLGLFPVFFDKQGTMYSVTKYQDYPLIMPQKKISDFTEMFPGWMLLSYKKNVTVSSSVNDFPSSNMTDENIKTYWAAGSGDKGEFAILDLGKTYDVYAIQINFAEHNASIYGRTKDVYHRYTVEYSKNNKKWKLLLDNSKKENDNPHDYTQLTQKVSCRYLKITNIEVPGGQLAVSGFRVFGRGNGKIPGKIDKFEVKYNPNDKRSVKLSWSKSDNSTGYNICYGVDKKMLYQNYQVYQDTTLTINSLNSTLDYYFSIESFNENGITTNERIVKAK